MFAYKTFKPADLLKVIKRVKGNWYRYTLYLKMSRNYHKLTSIIIILIFVNSASTASVVRHNKLIIIN